MTRVIKENYTLLTKKGNFLLINIDFPVMPEGIQMKEGFCRGGTHQPHP